MKDLCIVYFSIGNTIFSARIMATGIIPLANNVRHISLQNLDMDNLEWKAGFSSTKTTFVNLFFSDENYGQFKTMVSKMPLVYLPSSCWIRQTDAFCHLGKKNPVDHCRSCVRNLKGLRYFFQRSIYWRKKTLRLQGIGTYANVDVIMWNSRWLQRKIA